MQDQGRLPMVGLGEQSPAFSDWGFGQNFGYLRVVLYVIQGATKWIIFYT